MMYRRVEGRVRFACEDCGLEVATKGALVGHRKTCGAGGWLEDRRRECGRCGARVSYVNFARHVRSCRTGGRGAAAAGDGGVGGAGGSERWGPGCERGGEEVTTGEAGDADGGRRMGMDVGGVGRRISCQYCGRVVTIRNMARHLSQFCRVWNPGGGGRPRSAVSGQRKEVKLSIMLLMPFRYSMCNIRFLWEQEG